MAELEGLKRQRKYLRSAVTRADTFLNNYNNEIADVLDLRERHNNFKLLLDQFITVQNSIDDLETPERDEIAVFEENYYKISSKFLKKLRELEHISTSSTINHSNTNLNNVKLPQIDLPKFTGAFDEWIPFYNTFKSMIHECKELNALQKMYYLVGACKDEAAEVLNSLELCPENYSIAWGLLVDTFHNKRRISQKHIQAIYELPIASNESPETMRQIVRGLLKHTRALTALGRPTEHWDDLLIFLINRKLDSITAKEFERTLNKTDFPTLTQFTEFILQKCNSLDVCPKSELTCNAITSRNAKPFKTEICKCCNKSHSLSKCIKFKNMSVDNRFKFIKDAKLCVNCLKHSNHTVANCNRGNCLICNKKHNTLLHQINPLNQTNRNTNSTSETTLNDSGNNVNRTTVALSLRQNMPLLTTAVIKVLDNRNNYHLCRVILDSASQTNFISKKFADKLNLSAINDDILIEGLNNIKTNTNSKVKIQFKSYYNSFYKSCYCHIVENVTSPLPSQSFPKHVINIPKNCNLADPEFNISKEIDGLIGTEVFWDLFCAGHIYDKSNKIHLMKTHLGWVVGGNLPLNTNSKNSKRCHLSTEVESSLNFNLQKFWELETLFENPLNKPQTHMDKICEQLYANTFKRTESGRFIVQLPFKRAENLGNSKFIAAKCFYNLEKKFKANPELKRGYSEFMKEYILLGHMTRVDPDHSIPHYYLPHHAVIKEHAISTKLRVVFNGSSKTDKGLSLNDVLYKGPVLQHDLFDILIRFRSYKYVFSADIEKMYRQILIDKCHTPFQRIIWRDNPNNPLEHFELNTVTYGTAPAGYLAVRCLVQLAHEAREKYLHASEIIQSDFYMDDLLTGSNDLTDAIKLRDEIIFILKGGCFKLNKWRSNDEHLMKGMSDINNDVISLDKDSFNKILGMNWHPACDSFNFDVPHLEIDKITKRIMLSNSSKLFDPLGLANPITVLFKIMLQELWQMNLKWDDPVPIAMANNFKLLIKELHVLKSLKIPRYIFEHGSNTTIELLGFCDASERAYGACIYARTRLGDEVLKIQLMCAKSRVAPLKTLTMPRLELCGALVLAQLMTRIQNSLKVTANNVSYYTDSNIVLSWIHAPSVNFKIFVANRLEQILSKSSAHQWRYVSSKLNPADVLSRGCKPSELLKNKLWWHGPQNLDDSLNFNCHIISDIKDLPEYRSRTLTFAVINNNTNIFDKFSSFRKLYRVIAYCRRFCFNSKPNTSRIIGPLTANEVNESKLTLVRIAQLQRFDQEISCLAKGKAISKNSKILNLNPFINSNGILCVGGRLKNADLTSSQKYPYILPKSHNLTNLIIKQVHEDNFHSGTLATLAFTRQQYWPLDGKNSIKNILKHCVKCFKCKPQSQQPIMGDLPHERVNISKPFYNVGIDFCGPFCLKEGKRKFKIIKSYAAVFICLSTKAVHIELVSDLTTEAFVACLRRFVGRRGICKNVYSDNASNFVGANTELKRLLKFVQTQLLTSSFSDLLSDLTISWHFIPARSPHFGGLWEAAVKSVKRHLQHVIGETKLTFEELATIFVQIEAILNSRPITPISNDPNDLSYLTPGHFLVGECLTAIPSPDLSHLKLNTLSRWQLVQLMQQHFWKRWSQEYLNQLQTRVKWKTNNHLNPIKEGDLVLLREDNLPPTRWLTARVETLHPGADRVVRAVTVRTANGVYKRATNRVCLFPGSANTQ